MDGEPSGNKLPCASQHRRPLSRFPGPYWGYTVLYTREPCGYFGGLELHIRRVPPSCSSEDPGICSQGLCVGTQGSAWGYGRKSVSRGAEAGIGGGFPPYDAGYPEVAHGQKDSSEDPYLAKTLRIPATRVDHGQTGRPHKKSLRNTRVPSWLAGVCPPLSPWLKPIITQIELWTRHTLPKGPDGCPCPFHPDTMPAKWTWDHLYALVYQRRMRMIKLCNRKFVTVDIV